MSTTTQQQSDWPNPTYAWLVVVILMLAYTNSFIDRQILNLLIEPIREDLGINDTQISLLAGLAFSVFYTLAAIPIAKLADRSNRRRIIVVGVVVWSFMTSACGLAKNYWQLFLARVGVGFGEAALSPAALSIISDYFPPEKRTRAISVYSMGAYVGAGLALIAGGAVISAVGKADSLVLPLLGELKPWQFTFVFVGALGLPLLALLYLIREPLRRGVVASETDKEGWGPLIQYVRENRKTVFYHFSAFSLMGIGIFGFLVWTPTLFIRTYGWAAPDIAYAFGIILLTSCTAGVFLAGSLTDRLTKRGSNDAAMRVNFYAGLVSIPLVIATPLMPTAELALVLLVFTMAATSFPQALAAAALQVAAPNHLRAQLVAFYYMIGSLVASGVGPTLYALVTDYVLGDPMQIRYSLAIVAGGIYIIGTLLAFLCMPHYAETMRKTKALLAKES